MPWRGGKPAAVSLTFDDNLSRHEAFVVRTLNAAAIRGTFFVITGQNPANLGQAAVQGFHEVGSHSVSHVDLRNSPNLVNELANSQQWIQSRFGAKQGTTIAWPFGGNNPSVRAQAANYYIGARNASVAARGYELSNYKNFYQVGSYLMGASVQDSTYRRLISYAIRDTGWFVPLYHAVAQPGYNPVDSANFEAQVLALKQNEDKLWIAPFGTVLQYHRLRLASVLIPTYLPPSAGLNKEVSVYLGDTMSAPGSYDTTLTIRGIYTPANPQVQALVEVFQGNNLVYSKPLSFVNAVDTFYVDLKRGMVGGAATIKVGPLINSNRPGFHSAALQLSPNPTAEQVQVWGLAAPQGYLLYNALGQLQRSGTVSPDNPSLSLGGLPEGVYSLRIGSQVLRVVKE